MNKVLFTAAAAAVAQVSQGVIIQEELSQAINRERALLAQIDADETITRNDDDATAKETYDFDVDTDACVRTTE